MIEYHNGVFGELEPLTDERLAEIRGRLESATAWPWCEDTGGDVLGEGKPVCERPHQDHHPLSQQFANMGFIAHAPADMAALLAEVDSLRARAEKAEAERDNALDVLMGAMEQACEGDNVFDSMALGYYADALHVLAESGRIRITHEFGRRVIAVRADQVQPRGER